MKSEANALPLLWQAGWNQPGVRFVVCLHELGWNEAWRIQKQAVFLSPLSPVYFLEKDPAKFFDLGIKTGIILKHKVSYFTTPCLYEYREW